MEWVQDPAGSSSLTEGMTRAGVRCSLGPSLPHLETWSRPAPPTGRGQHLGGTGKRQMTAPSSHSSPQGLDTAGTVKDGGDAFPLGAFPPFPSAGCFLEPFSFQSSRGLLPTVPGKTAHPSFLNLLHHWLPCPQAPGCSSPETTPSPFTAPLISPSFPARGTPQCSVLGTLHFFFHDGLPQKNEPSQGFS